MPTGRTAFIKDIEGRYLRNDLNEVNAWKKRGRERVIYWAADHAAEEP